MVAYSVVAVAYTPKQTAAATLTEIGPLLFEQLMWEHELNRDGRWSVTVQGSTLDPDIVDRLIRLDERPMEVHIWRDDTLVMAGPVCAQEDQPDGRVTLSGGGPGYWLRYGALEAKYAKTGTDVAAIGKGLIDTWQALDYANSGILTDTYVGTVGQTIDVDWDLDRVWEPWVILTNLLTDYRGYSFSIRPDRHFVCPVVGTDRSADLVLDGRSVAQQSVSVSLTAGRFASVGRVANGTAVRSYENSVLLASAGRRVIAKSVQETNTSRLADMARQLQEDNGEPQRLIGGQIFTVTDLDPTDLDVGDTVGYDYDLGWVNPVGKVVVARKRVAVGRDGSEKMTVEPGVGTQRWETIPQKLAGQETQIRRLTAEVTTKGTGGGNKGDQGDPGPKGDQGDPGPKGDTGSGQITRIYHASSGTTISSSQNGTAIGLSADYTDYDYIEFITRGEDGSDDYYGSNKMPVGNMPSSRDTNFYIPYGSLFDREFYVWRNGANNKLRLENDDTNNDLVLISILGYDL